MNRCLLSLLSSEETSSTWELGQNTLKEEDKQKSTALTRGYNLTTQCEIRALPTDCKNDDVL